LRLHRPGSRCPFCRRADIEAGPIVAEDNSARGPVASPAWRRERRDLSFLAAIRTVDDACRYVDTALETSKRSAGGASGDPGPSYGTPRSIAGRPGIARIRRQPG
jgi:hypothetical protein